MNFMEILGIDRKFVCIILQKIKKISDMMNCSQSKKKEGARGATERFHERCHKSYLIIAILS